jgi:hypothetical protein
MAKRARRVCPVTIVTLSYLLLSSKAHAVLPADEAAADLLFNQATEAALAGRFDEACPKFAAAHRLDPTAGTLLNLGRCEEDRHNLATAYGAYVAAAALARQENDKKGREARARDAALKIEPKLAMLVIVVPMASRLEGIEIKRNGKALDEGQWGAGVPMDPGSVTIEASAPGHTPWKQTVTIAPKPGNTTIEVPPLARSPVAQGPVSNAAEVEEQGTAWNSQKTAALAVGGAGVIGLALGTIFGVKAIGKKSDADTACQPNAPTQCNAAGVALRHEEKNAGTISTASFVAGGVALAGGVVLFVTAPERPATKNESVRFEVWPAVAGGDMGLMFRGSW